eukprot:gene26886-biopygen17471
MPIPRAFRRHVDCVAIRFETKAVT